MPSKGKAKRDVNPTDAFRKMERNKEKKRNKMERQKVRADAELRRDPDKCREELTNLELKARHKLTGLKEERRMNELKEYLRTAEFRRGAEVSSEAYVPPQPPPKSHEKGHRVSFVDDVGVPRDQRPTKTTGSSGGGGIVILPEDETDAIPATAAEHSPAEKEQPAKQLKPLPPGFMPPLPLGPPPKHAATTGIAAQYVSQMEAVRKETKRLAAAAAMAS